MKIAQINLSYAIGSTGKIVADLEQVIKNGGEECISLVGYSSKTMDTCYVIEKLPFHIAARKNILISRLTGVMGYRKKCATKRAIKWLELQKPDVIHLHNIHGDWINIELLIKYVKDNNIPVVWTLHDTWAFTGRCSFPDSCSKWRVQCEKCDNKRIYPVTYFFDFSKSMFCKKRDMFSGIKNITLVTPSKWLSSIVHESFMKDYSITVIASGIDVEVFKHITTDGMCGKRIILGVANVWTERKGLSTFIELDKIINHDEYQIIVVGLNERQMSLIPNTVIGMTRTNSVEALVKIYSSAFVFVNPSVLETQGLTTIEAMACGVPVITSDKTAVPECVSENCGIVLHDMSPENIRIAIEQIAINREVYTDQCRQHVVKNYNKDVCFLKYLELYKKLIQDK